MLRMVGMLRVAKVKRAGTLDVPHAAADVNPPIGLVGSLRG
jgi:hypothetical protein